MYQVGLVVVGDGVINGDFVDGASPYVVARLEEYGVDVARIEFAGNSAQSIENAVRNIFERTGIQNVITLGALGVDLRGHNHRSGVARALESEINYYPTIAEHISESGAPEAINAHAFQSEHWHAIETRATVPLFINYSQDRQLCVISLSGYPDLLKRQLSAYIDSQFYTGGGFHQFDISTTAKGFTPDAEKLSQLARINDAVATNDDYVKSLYGVEVFFDHESYSPQRFAFLSAHLRSSGIGIAGAAVMDVGDIEDLIAFNETSATRIIVSDGISPANHPGYIYVSPETPESITTFDLGGLPRVTRVVTRTNANLDDVENAIRYDVRLSEEHLSESDFSDKPIVIYTSVPNIDDPSTGATIEFTTANPELNAHVSYVIAQIAAENGWEIDQFFDVKPNTTSTQNWDAPYSAQALMEMPGKKFWPLPEALGATAFEMLANPFDFTDAQAQQIVDSLMEVHYKNNQPGDYEFSVYENTLGVVRPEALTVAAEIRDRFAIVELPDTITAEQVEIARHGLSMSDARQYRHITEPPQRPPLTLS